MTNQTNRLQIELMNYQNETAECIKNFPFGEKFSPSTIGYKVSDMIVMMDHMIKYTKSELINYFTRDEARLLASSFTSSLYSPKSGPKASLYLSVSGSIAFEPLIDSLDVDEDEIMGKIEKLTSFQAFCVMSMCFEYLNRLASEGCFDKNSAVLKEVFQIQD